MNSLLKIFDLYTIRARLLPALIAAIPIIALIATFLDINKYILANTTLAFIALLILIPLLGKISRSQGQKVEQRVLKKWKVLPTTRYLRHLDETYSTTKKNKLHKILSEKTLLQLPNRDEESIEPEQADEIYAEAVSWLRENTRDPKFGILLNENIAYGMYRNLLGLKPIAIILSILPLVVFSILFLLNYPDISNINLVELIAFLEKTRLAYWVTTFISTCSIILWVSYINESGLEKAANKYADTLFKQIDAL